MGRWAYFNPPLLAGVAQLVEQLICNQQVGGSSPLASSTAGRPSRTPRQNIRLEEARAFPKRALLNIAASGSRWLPRGFFDSFYGCFSMNGGFQGRFPSGQRDQTVNLTAQPSEVRILPSPPADRHAGRLNTGALDSEAGIAQMVEHQPSKLRVAGSSPVSRSRMIRGFRIFLI